MTLALIISAVGSMVGLAGPLLIQNAMDVAVPNKDVELLLLLGALLFATVIISIGFGAVRTLLMVRVEQAIIHDIRRDLFAHLQVLPFSYYDNRPQGKILVRVVHYVNAVSDTLSNGVLNLIIEVFNTIFIIFFMFQISVPLAAVTCAGLPLIIGFVFLIKPRQRKAWQAFSDKNANMNAFIQESIDGAKVVQSFDRQKTNLSIFERLTKLRYKEWMKAQYVSNSVWFTTETVSQLVFTAVYIIGVYLINPMVSFGVLLAMGTYSARFWQPIINIANIYNNFMNTIAYLERIFETMNTPAEIEDVPNAYDLPPIKGEVEFKDVVFGYEKGQTVLNGVSFKAKPGESIAIVGPTGAGKTTIVNLISRFYNITGGEVLIDGHSVMDVTLHSLRSQLGIMLQECFVFSGTIADNIRYGKLDATDDEVIAASKAAGAHEFIMSMKNGYSESVKERGSGLSQGQKQLLAFARTILSNPKILVLDEATSSIDTQTEKLVQEGIKAVMKHSTSFVIAHRLSTIRTSDRILYIDNGKILESGTHDELMAQKGYYYKLTMAQYQNV